MGVKTGGRGVRDSSPGTAGSSAIASALPMPSHSGGGRSSEQQRPPSRLMKIGSSTRLGTTATTGDLPSMLSASSGGKSPSSSSFWMTAPPEEQMQFQQQRDDEEDNVPGERLDPKRNDDLPARPTTSRGRVASSDGTDRDSYSRGPLALPSWLQPVQKGAAQVLDVLQDDPDDTSDQEDDAAYRHLYSYVPRDAEDLARHPTVPGAAAAAAAYAAGSAGSFSSATTSSVLPTKGPSRGQQQPPASQASSSRSAPSPQEEKDPLDPSEAAYAWRAEVERSLSGLAASTAATLAASSSSASAQWREAMAATVRDTSTLGAHVEYMRRQPGSSRWLNAPSLTFHDATGSALTVREAVAEHVFRLMDLNSAELLLKACGIVLRVVKSRQPLLQTSRLLYRLSKDTANDVIFRKERLLEPILKTISVMVASVASSSQGSSSSPSMHEPLVYLGGCLKNVSNDLGIQKHLVKLGALPCLASLLLQVTTTPALAPAQAAAAAASGSASSSAVDLATQVAVQATGALRNLAVSEAHAALFVSAGVLPALQAAALPALAKQKSGAGGGGGGGGGAAAGPRSEGSGSALAASGRYDEVVLNVGRILSKLSLHEDCQAVLEADPAYASLMVGLLWQYRSHRAILLRIAFVMGNLTTGSDRQRKQIASVPGAIASIVSILGQYTAVYCSLGVDEDLDIDGGRVSSSKGGSSASAVGVGVAAADRLTKAAKPEDCLVKILRLIANLAIHSEVGPMLAGQSEVAQSLLFLLTSAFSEERRKAAGGGERGEPSGDGSGGGGELLSAEEEELVLNCICALTNLSFYHDLPGGNKVLELDPEILLHCLTPLLMCENEEAMVEAARAYGNFSRVPEAREYIQKARVLEAMLLLLDHSNQELLYSVCGTLINFTVESDRKQALVDLGGVSSLIEVIERTVTSAELTELEASILLLLFKALYNICADDSCSEGDDEPQPRLPVSEEEVTTLEAIVEHVASAEEFAEQEELLGIVSRLAEQLATLSSRGMASPQGSHDLEPL